MADRMLTFPSRSSSATEVELLPRQNMPQPTAMQPTPRRRGLFLVKGEHAVPAPEPAKPAARTWQTREIVAQVEREVAAMAARHNAQRLKSSAAGTSLSLERDTPWTVIARVIRRLRP